MKKTCRGCQQTKPTTEFWKAKASRDGLFRLCKPCGRAANKRTYSSNQSRELARNQQWRDGNKPTIRARKQRTRAARVQWLVYRLNFLDGCFYIGSTNDLDTRLSLHRWEMRQGLHRNGNIRAAGYGPDEFTAEIIIHVDSEDDARRQEGELIDAHFGQAACLNQQRVSDLVA